MLMFPKGVYKKKSIANKRALVPESIIQRQCEDYLDVIGLQYIRLPDWLNHALYAYNSPIPIHIKRSLATYTKGQPDLVILDTKGRYLAVELKTEIGKLTHAQKTWHKNARVYICRSFDEFQKLLNNWITGSGNTSKPPRVQDPWL